MPDAEMPKDVELCHLCLIEINGISQAIPMPAGWTLVALPMTAEGRERAWERLGLTEAGRVHGGHLLDRLLEGRHYLSGGPRVKIEKRRLAVTEVLPAEDGRK